MSGTMGQLGIHAADALFGPQFLDKFDFTLFFENTILSVLPNVVFVIGSLVCLLQISRQTCVVRPGILWWLKFVTSALLLITEICALVLWTLPGVRTQSAVAAASTSCLASLFVIVLADAEHRRSLHASGWLSFYLGIYTLLCAAKARSLFLRPELRPLASLQVVSIGLEAVMLILGEIPKASEIIDSEQRKAAGPETLAGFWNRSLFIWLFPTLYAGSKRPLDTGDLHNLDQDMRGDRLFAIFTPIWNSWHKSSSSVLFKVLIWTLFRSILIAMVPRLSLIGFSFAQPYLLEQVVSLLEDKNIRQDFENGLIVAAVLIYTGITISRSWYNYLVVRMATKTRGILISAVYDKTLKLEHNQAKKLAAVTLMSTDADGVSLNVRTLYELVANLLELAVGMGLLAKRVGPACILLLVPTALLSGISTKFGRKVAPAQVMWNKSIETRVSSTSGILRQIRAIKMVGQGPAATHYIQELRKAEIDESTKFRFLQAVLLANAMLIYCLTPISVMAGSIFWTRAEDTLRASDVFTILSIVAIVSTPLSKVVACYPGVAATFGSLSRIEAFLRLDERCDQRKFMEPSVRSIVEAFEKGDSSFETDKMNRPGRQNRQSWEVDPVDALRVEISATKTSGIIVNNSTFWIPRRKFTMLVGRTGRGKSTLLRALLGEAIISAGKISLERDFIAYCDQEVWVQNISVRENIVGACKYDARWYGTVVRACQLLLDIQSFPHGDDTIVGSDGLRLSGGQKARLALARAIYALAPLILLDDVFSTLDEATADVIFDELLGPYGILRGTECAVVLATSSGKYLPMADHLLYLDANRNVAIITDRSQMPGYAQYLQEQPVDGAVETASVQSTASDGQIEQAPSLPEPNAAAQFRQHGDRNLYTLYFKVVPKKLLAFWLTLLCFFALSERSPEIYMRIWLATFPTNKLFFIGYSLLGVACGILGLSQIYIFWLKVTPKASENLHKQFLDVVMSATYEFITSTDAGFLLNRFGGDMTVIGQELPKAMSLVLYDTFLILIDIAIISAGAKYMAFAIPFLFFGLYLLQSFYLQTSRRLRFMDLEAKSPLYTHFTETTRGLAHIRAFRWEASFIEKFHKRLQDSQKPYYQLTAVQQWLTTAMDCVGMMLCITLVALASRFKGSSPSGTGLALLNLITFSEQLMFLMKDWTGLETSLGAIARLDQFIKDTPVEKDAPDITPLPLEWPENGTIEFRGVDAGYGGQSENRQLVLNQLSLRIPGGSNLGVTGRTGCGKTTMFLTLLNLLDHDGPLLIDGVDISEVPRQLLRTRITTISQDFFELPGTLRDNLLPPEIMRPKSADRRLDDDAIHNVLFVAGLDDIVNDRGGLNAPFDELGLSHGERQLVALARGIIHTLEFKTKIVLLDEVTGVLDSDTRATMNTVMNGYFANHTVITIAHRMDALRDANKIYDMNENRVYQ